MSIFEKGSREKVRFNTDRGTLATEDLWDLSRKKLNAMAKVFNKELKLSEEEDFLGEESAEDTITRLKFEIVIHILRVKTAEKKAKDNASIVKAEKQRLLAIKERKLNEADEGMSIEELDKKLAELG